MLFVFCSVLMAGFHVSLSASDLLKTIPDNSQERYDLMETPPPIIQRSTLDYVAELPENIGNFRHSKFLGALFASLFKEADPIAIQLMHKHTEMALQKVSLLDTNEDDILFYDGAIKLIHATGNSGIDEFSKRDLLLKGAESLGTFFHWTCNKKPDFQEWCHNVSKRLIKPSQSETIKTAKVFMFYISRIMKWVPQTHESLLIYGDLITIRARIFMNMAHYDPMRFEMACTDFTEAFESGVKNLDAYKRICQKYGNTAEAMRYNVFQELTQMNVYFLLEAYDNAEDYAMQTLLNEADSCNRNYTRECFSAVYLKMYAAYSQSEEELNENVEFLWRFVKMTILSKRISEIEILEDEIPSSVAESMYCAYKAVNFDSGNAQANLWFAAALDYAADVEDNIETSLRGYLIKEYAENARDLGLTDEPYLYYLLTKLYFGASIVGMAHIGYACDYFNYLNNDPNEEAKDTLTLFLMNEGVILDHCQYYK